MTAARHPDGPPDSWLLRTPPHYDDVPGPDPDAPLTSRMLDAGYDWDGEQWSRVVSRVTRTARKAHHGIAVGQRYVETTTITVDARGRSSRSRALRMVRAGVGL